MTARARRPAAPRCLALALLVLLGMGGAARAWDALDEAIALLPQPVRGGSLTEPFFGYADLARLQQDGDLRDLLTIGWRELFDVLEEPEAMPRLLGVPRQDLRRVLHGGTAVQQLRVLWGGPGFAAAADARLAARGFASTALGGDRLFSRGADRPRDARDPFGFAEGVQHLLGFGTALAGAADAGEMRALHARRQPGAELSALARALRAAVAPIRAGLPQGITVLQAAGFWPDAFQEGESGRHFRDRSRPVRPLPPGATANSPRLPGFGFALFIAAELRGSPVLMVAVAYDTAAQAAFAAPVIAAGVQALGVGDGPPPTRVHDWVFAGNGVHVAAATVLFGAAPRARASTALRRWLELVDLQAFTPLDLLH